MFVGTEVPPRYSRGLEKMAKAPRTESAIMMVEIIRRTLVDDVFSLLW
jgi:hypothetical protein